MEKRGWGLGGRTIPSMRYIEPLFRPPAEADSFILQATLGCSWNRCGFCAMYRAKTYMVRPLEELITEVREAGRRWGDEVRHVFVADGDPLAMPMEVWEPLLTALGEAFPRLRRVSTYATARNVLAKTPGELARLRERGLNLLYLGPESGDDATLKRLGKGATAEEHVEAARLVREAGMHTSLMFLLGAGGAQHGEAHARASGRLATAMDPRYLSTLTLTLVPGTPLAKAESEGRFTLPDVRGLLHELVWFLEEAQPTNAIFRSDHASNHLALDGRLPRDREALLARLRAALEGRQALRPEWMRGL